MERIRDAPYRRRKYRVVPQETLCVNCMLLSISQLSTALQPKRGVDSDLLRHDLLLEVEKTEISFSIILDAHFPTSSPISCVHQVSYDRGRPGGEGSILETLLHGCFTEPLGPRNQMSSVLRAGRQYLRSLRAQRFLPSHSA